MVDVSDCFVQTVLNFINRGMINNIVPHRRGQKDKTGEKMTLNASFVAFH